MAQELDARNTWGGHNGSSQSEPTTARIPDKKPRRPPRPPTPKNPDAFFITAEQVGRIIGIQEIDARQLMERGVIQSYWHRSHLKTSRQDVNDFLEQLRQGKVSVKNVICPVTRDPSTVSS